MLVFTNVDLFSVGVAAAAIGLLGFIVFFNNRQSFTNRTFLMFALVAITWSGFNYASYQPNSPLASLWLLRLQMFFAVWYCFSLFQLFFVFPKTEADFPLWYNRAIVPGAWLVSLLTLTPFVFSNIVPLSDPNQLPKVEVAPGIVIFGIVVIGLISGGLITLLRRYNRAVQMEKSQLKYVLSGALTTFLLHIIFNFILPAFFDVRRFIPFGAVFIFPFAACTAYAIFRHHLFNVKVIATEILSFLLSIVTLIEVILSKDTATLIFRLAIFVPTLAFSVLLIQSVLKEVKQREELQALTDELKAANKKLEELSRFKTQLLSLASHQIKAPLAAIKGFVSLLADGSYGPVADKQKETFQKIKGEADELIELINTLLDLRKVDEGKMEYTFAETEFVALAKNVVEGLQPLADQKKLALSFSSGGGPIKVKADAPKLTQVVRNLIDNAIKYTPQGFVKVDVHPTADQVIYSVTDSGLGMSHDLLPYLFEEFVRDERVKTQIRGTGLGLYIARKIVEAHGGKIWAESPGEGKGSTFFVSLPRA